MGTNCFFRSRQEPGRRIATTAGEGNSIDKEEGRRKKEKGTARASGRIFPFFLVEARASSASSASSAVKTRYGPTGSGTLVSTSLTHVVSGTPPTFVL